MRFFFTLSVFIIASVGNVRMELNNYLADNNGGVTEKSYVFWPNATIPFYINPEHFDDEQSSSIMTTLALFAFKTCLKFLPVLSPPEPDQHVLVFANPTGVRHCSPTTKGHAMDEVHTVNLGYECLRPPHIEMMIMKALGFPFEHNRLIRDQYIEVQHENIEPSAMELFNVEAILPKQLQLLKYDVDSVMHFGERHYSKNGHRTIIFKDQAKRPVKPNRVGLSPTDLRKIEIIYGPECRKRDRQEKIEMCQNYPGVARRKREVTETANLRVNRDITPPPKEVTGHLNDSLKELGIEDEVQEVVDHVYKVSSKALKNARAKYCNLTKPDLRASSEKLERNSSHDILGIIETIADYARNMVDIAVANLTEFCQASESIEAYQRARCQFGGYDCPVRYKSTKSGNVMYSTQHRPLIYQSTKHRGRPYRAEFDPLRAGNQTSETTTAGSRRKRHNEVDEVKNKNDGKVEEATAVTNINVNETNAPEVGNSTRTDGPGEKEKFEVEHNRRIFKATRGSKSEELYDSNLSIEVPVEKPRDRIRQKHNIPKGRKEKKHRESRLRDQGEDAPPAKDLPKTVQLSKANLEFYNDRKWPDGVVRYILDANTNYDLDDVRARLAEVNSILKRKTCVSLKEITEEDAQNYEDYLVVDTSADYVTGRVGGKQNFGVLELFRGGQHRQHAAMVVMAMLGFYFELARHDRDKYVRVHLRHVRADKLHHFEKIRSDATFPLPYDYESATHPAWQFWRKVGKKGISSVATYKTKDPDGSIMKSMGQNEKLLSDLDLIKINSVYGTKCFTKTRSAKSGKKKRVSQIKPEE